MPDSLEAQRAVVAHQRRWSRATPRDLDCLMRSVDWRTSARGNLWARVDIEGISTRITVFLSQYHEGVWCYVWARENRGDTQDTPERHFSRAHFDTMESAKIAALYGCGYMVGQTDMPTVPVEPPRPKRTPVLAEPPARLIIL